MIKPELIQEAIKLISKRDANYRHFFDKLPSAKWIKPLWENKLFKEPPSPLSDGTYINFPFWPESRYLARVADQDPETVLEVISNIPETENTRVHEDYVEALLKMSPELGVKLLDKVLMWAKSKYQLSLPRLLGDLMVHWANDGKAVEALRLADVLFDIRPKSDEGDENARLSRYLRSQTYIGEWEYQEILTKQYPEVVKTSGIDAIKLLIEKLNKAIEAERTDNTYEGPEDYSYIWRPAIEEHSQNFSWGATRILVAGLRNTAEQLISEHLTTFDEVLAILEAQRWIIFHRIALYLIRIFPSLAEEQIRVKLTNKGLFDNHSLKHEYALLLKEHFDSLSPEDQDKILSWINDGPDEKEYIDLYKSREGIEPTREWLTQAKNIWRRDRLAWFKDSLPDDWRKKYDELVKELGEPEHPDFASYSESWSGPISPISADQLKKKTPNEVVEYLKTWQPPDKKIIGPSPEPWGLAITFGSLVAEMPAEYSEVAGRIKEVDPDYGTEYLRGLREAVTNKKPIQWQPVLDLCKWIVSQSQELGDAIKKGWGRKAVADLLESGFNNREAEVPFGMRELLWEILLPLTEDADPTPERESKSTSSLMGASSVAINSVRGEAMHAVIKYAFWVDRNMPRVGGGIPSGFDAIPEVKAVLDKHLNISVDGSLAIRSVYGQYFPWLNQIDPEWTRASVNKIFPLDGAGREYFMAAWLAYVMFNRAYRSICGLLLDQYKFAIELSSEKKGGRKELSEEDMQLARHLMQFYWMGELDDEPGRALLDMFWQEASESLSAYAIEFIGDSLRGTAEGVNEKIISKLQELWENRLAVNTSSGTCNKAQIASFGYWFGSGKFNIEWALSQLLEAIKVAGYILDDRHVIKLLAEIADSKPLEAVACLRTIVKMKDSDWGIYGWEKGARSILLKALNSDIKGAVESAVSLIHEMGSMGFNQFRDLLKKK
ncbi:MAG: hypothetical protein ACYDFU_00690 [Nitrospirota bacterium]